MKTIFLVWVLSVAFAITRKNIPFSVTSPEFDVSAPQRYISDGLIAKYRDYPYMIFVILKCHVPGWQRCSGSLVTKNAVLTAAHCIDFPGVTPKNIFLVGGQADLRNYTVNRFKVRLRYGIDEKKFRVQERRASRYFIHPKYKNQDNQILHNIAFIEFCKPFSSKIVKTIKLSYERLKFEKKCTVPGWGLTRNRVNQLLHVIKNKDMSTTTLQCKFQYNQKISMLCLNPVGSGEVCGSGSGSPLICDEQVWGVASHMMAESSDCAHSVEDYYSSISVEKDWLENMMKSLSGVARSVEINFSRVAVCASVTFLISWGIFS